MHNKSKSKKAKILKIGYSMFWPDFGYFKKET